MYYNYSRYVTVDMQNGDPLMPFLIAAMKKIFKAASIVVAVSIPLLAAHAESQTSKDWFWDVSDNFEVAGQDFIYAATVNADGRVLGQYCYISEGSCYYLVELGITCDTDSEYPSLLNSDKAAISINLVCGHKVDSGSNVFFIKPFDDVDNIVLSANSIGFAVAMEAGTFKVVRFSLSGSTHAIKMMTRGAEILQESKSGTQRSLSSEEYL